MAANKTNHGEDQTINWLLVAAETPTRPPGRYLALFSADPGEASGGTEISGTGYARQSITFSSASGGATANTNALTFGPITSGGPRDVTHIVIFDAVTSGNRLYAGPATNTRTVSDGDSYTVAIGAITVTET